MLPLPPQSTRPFPRPILSFRILTTTIVASRRFPDKRRFPAPLKFPFNPSSADSEPFNVEEPSALDDFTALTNSAPDDYQADSTDTSAPPLRGSDVLLALQRAVKKKEKQQWEKKRSGNERKSSKRKDLKDILDVEEEVRPIVVRKDWETRMDELEKKIRELLLY